MASVNMANINMVKVNTLIRKGYLLAGVLMAANMLVVNEVRAMEEVETEENENTLRTEEKDKKFPIINVLLNSSGPVLYWENTINLAVGFVFSSVNNYFRWWDYNAGSYRKLGCFGWRSGRFLKDYLQFEINLNVGRGILWLIPGVFGLMQYISKKEDPSKSTAGLIMKKILKDVKEDNKTSFGIFYSIIFSLQGFISAPLAIHISNFSIAISLDSIFWASIGKFLSLPAVDGYEKLKQDEDIKE